VGVGESVVLLDVDDLSSSVGAIVLDEYLSVMPDMQVAISIMPSMRSLLSASIEPMDDCSSLTDSRSASKSSMETISSHEHPSEGPSEGPWVVSSAQG